MLSITEAQVEVFSQLSLSDYINHIHDYFCDPSIALLPADEKEQNIANIDLLIDKAESFEIYTEGDVQHFIEFSLKLGMDFAETNKWAKDILQTPHYLGVQKITALAPLVDAQYKQLLQTQESQNS